jgi:hypothetical protein
MDEAFAVEKPRISAVFTDSPAALENIASPSSGKAS